MAWWEAWWPGGRHGSLVGDGRPGGLLGGGRPGGLVAGSIGLIWTDRYSTVSRGHHTMVPGPRVQAAYLQRAE